MENKVLDGKRFREKDNLAKLFFSSKSFARFEICSECCCNFFQRRFKLPIIFRIGKILSDILRLLNFLTFWSKDKTVNLREISSSKFEFETIRQHIGESFLNIIVMLSNEVR